ncbi:MAG: SpoIIE family protein phosphatase, partial [Pygmaiobacter sp.]
ALSLPTGEAGATLDVLTFDLFQGVCEVYKAGAAPTYFVRGGRVGCLSAQTLPLGVLNEVRASATTLTLAPGDVAVLVSDGMLAAGDTWLQTELSRNWQRSAEEIARALLAGAKKRGASHVDDRTVAVAKLIPAGSTQGK